MSVLIKGMEMPKHCTECLFWHDGIWEHCILNEEIQNGDLPEFEGQYPHNCPLVEVSEPHGRLIDADAVIDLVMQYCPDDDGVCSKAGADLRELLDEIEDLPTTIPASEEG